MKIAFVPFLVFFSSHLILAQDKPIAEYQLTGDIRDQHSMVIPGMSLSVDGKRKGTTDINGKFEISVSEGDHIITSDGVAPEKFRLFVKIGGQSLPPNFISLVVDSDAIICSGNRGAQSPKVLKTFEPPYPAAAIAVRAGGEATVFVKIDPTGKVLSAKGVSGHPLLRRASEVAAEKFLFEESEDKSERETMITFVFLPFQDLKKGLDRYKCPYRIIVVSEPIIIETSTSY